MLQDWESTRSLLGSTCPRAWQSPSSCCSDETAPLHLIIFCMIASMKIRHCLRLQAISQQKLPSNMSAFSDKGFSLMEVAVIAICIPSVPRSHTTKSISSDFDAAFWLPHSESVQQLFFFDDAGAGGQRHMLEELRQVPSACPLETL